MAYFYVKNGGTATGDGGRYASQQTGAMTGLGTSGYYNAVSNAVAATTPPANGDFICIADNHVESPTDTSIGMNGLSANAGHILHWMSVDVSNIEQLKVATAAQFTPTNDVVTAGGSGNAAYFYGLYFAPADDFLQQINESALRFEKCIFDNLNGGSLTTFGSNSRYFLDSCSFKINDGGLQVSSSSNLLMTNCSWTFNGTGTAAFKRIAPTTATQVIDLQKCNLSGCSYITDLNIAPTDANLVFLAQDCKLGSSFTAFTSGSIDSRTTFVTMTGCGVSSATAEYSYYRYLLGSIAQHNTSLYRDDTVAFPGGQKTSLQIITASSCTKYAPFYFAYPRRFSDLTAAGSDAINIYLLSSDAALTNQDVWIEAYYPDSTDRSLSTASSSSTTDLWDTATSLTSDTSTWTGRTTETRYKISLTLSSGWKSAPFIRMYFGKASTTVYVDPVPVFD